MTEPHDVPHGTGTAAAAGRPSLLDPASRAVAGLALAVVGLMGQNVVQVVKTKSATQTLPFIDRLLNPALSWVVSRNSGTP